VWEHAYYLDHQHQRETYARKVIETRLNWDFAAKNLRDQ
jgi:superoxide dismutase